MICWKEWGNPLLLFFAWIGSFLNSFLKWLHQKKMPDISARHFNIERSDCFVRYGRVGELLPRASPTIRAITKSATKIKNRNSAMPAAVPAIPPYPKIAATIATIKNIRAHLSIVTPPYVGTRNAKKCSVCIIGFSKCMRLDFSMLKRSGLNILLLTYFF